MIILFNLYYIGHLCCCASGKTSDAISDYHMQECCTGVRSGMSSGVISQKWDLLERQLSEQPSKDDDQQLCGTEGQVQELSLKKQHNW